MAMIGLFSVCVFFVVSSGLSFPEQDIPNVTPDVLDALLKEKNYDLFSKLMKVDNVKLVRPSERERTLDPKFHEELEFGDMILSKEQQEQARQAIRMNKYPANKWSDNKMAYYINDDFSSDERATILTAIKSWNDQSPYLQLSSYNGESDYIYIFSGDGCWSYLGNQRGGQLLSLQKNGCVWKGTIMHEIMHACGFAHEQNRWDRDEYIQMLWENIPEGWKSQYEKTNSDDFGLHGCYDYYSIMHYPVNAPGTNKPAFKVLEKGIDENRIGWNQDFTETDKKKINRVYGPE